MEHITIIDLDNGYKRLIPDEGWVLVYNDTHYSEAVVKDIKGWTAIAIN